MFEYQFRVVTCIDAVINLHMVIPVDDAKSKTVANAFENHWLSQYPSPIRCIHDNGNEFLGPEFATMLAKNIITSIPKIVKTSQANAIVKRLHQIFNTTIVFSLQENYLQSFDKVPSLI